MSDENTVTCVICDTNISYDEVSQYAAFGGLPSPCCKICFEVNDYSIESLQDLKIRSLVKRMELEEETINGSNQQRPSKKDNQT